MANLQLMFVDQLDAKKDFVNMKLRIIRRWENMFYLNLILIDEKGKKIQAVVKKDLIPVLDEILIEDQVLLINKCGVGISNDPYPIINNKLRLTFYKLTKVSKVVGFSSGDLYGFSFVPFNNITVAKSKDITVLNVDVIGYVTWCGNLDIFKSARGKESKRFNFEMKDLDGKTLRCTLWDDYAIQFNNFVTENQSDEHVITIIQHGVIKEFNKTVTVQNHKYGTRVFINEEIKEANDFRRSLIVKQGNANTSQGSILSTQTVYPNRVEFLEATERKHVDEIMETDTPTECVVLATIAMLEPEFGWFYVACQSCNRKVVPKQDYLEVCDENDLTEEVLNAPPDSKWCKTEKIQATRLAPKFKVTFRVQDSTGSTSLTMFDRDVVRTLGLSATDIRERQLQGDDTEGYPHELDALLNRKYAFKIGISKYNLQKNYHVYTILKLCDDPEVIAELQAQDNPIEANQDSETQDVSAVKLSESSQAMMDSKDAASVTGEYLEAELEKDTDTSPFQKRINTPGANSSTRPTKKIRPMKMPANSKSDQIPMPSLSEP